MQVRLNGANFLGRTGDAELHKLDFAFSADERLSDGQVHEGLVVLGAAGVDDAGDGEIHSAAFVTERERAAGGKAEAAANVASDEAMREVGA